MGGPPRSPLFGTRPISYRGAATKGRHTGYHRRDLAAASSLMKATGSIQKEATLKVEKSVKPFLRLWLGWLGPFLGLFLVVAVFTLLIGSPAQYLSVTNLRIVLSQTVIVALGAIGMTIVIISGGIDLSAGSVIALAGVVTALGIQRGLPPLIAM